MKRRKARVTVSHPAAARAACAEVALLRELVAIDELLAGRGCVEGELVVVGPPGGLADRRLRREQIATRIAPALLESYQHARQTSASRPVVSLLGGRACGGCFLCIEPRLAVRFYDFGYVSCPHCERLIVAAKAEPAGQS